MEIDEKKRKELEELIELLGSIRGRHTELVTVLIPSGGNVNLVTRQLEGEKSTASNIKSTATRKNVISALDTIIRELKGMKETPKNGLAIYCGNISEKEGVSDIQLWTYEPPKPLNIKIYRCDQKFVVEPLEEMVGVEEVYGLLVIDRQHATIGLLEGKRIKVIQKFSSGVPGKIKAGGQCLSPDTLIMKDNGEIVEIKDSHNPLLVMSENFNMEKVEETPLIAKWESEKEMYKVITSYPKFEIKASRSHMFFVKTEKGIEEKMLFELKDGDYLVMPEKIDFSLDTQDIEFVPEIRRPKSMKEIKIPTKLDCDFARILGYYLGDGDYEADKVSFAEQRKDVADYYKKLIADYFCAKTEVKFREKKGNYQLRVDSRVLVQLFNMMFEEKEKSLKGGVPLIVMRSPDDVLASFIAGFFDAEGYVSKKEAIFGINNELLCRQMQFALLRLGILSSINIYDNGRSPYFDGMKHTLTIDDFESLKKFLNLAGFVSNEKKEKIKKLIREGGNRNKARQLVVNGKEVVRIIRNSGLCTTQFMCPDFFVNEKQLSKEAFKMRILDKIKDSELKRRLELFYLSNLIVVKIEKIESVGVGKTIDIETKNHNFLANGLIVHNSSQRFARITEGLAKEFFRRVAEGVKNAFFELPKLKGILIGGPIPTKEDFLDEGQLVTKLKEKVIAVKDIGYVDEHGLELLVEESQEDISEQELIKEKNVLTKFFETVGKNKKMSAYGEKDIRLALERGAVKTLILSNKLDKAKIKEFEKLANNIGSDVVVVSSEHQDGLQFFNLTKGLGAVLRFGVE